LNAAPTHLSKKDRFLNGSWWQKTHVLFGSIRQVKDCFTRIKASPMIITKKHDYTRENMRHTLHLMGRTIDLIDAFSPGKLA
jgi:hypothetical protein